MIRTLRRRFILIAMASLIGTLVVFYAGIGISSLHATTWRMDRVLSLLYENGGEFPLPRKPTEFKPTGGFQVTFETPFETRYFTVKLTAHQEVVSINMEHIAALDRQTVVENIGQVLSANADHGYIDYYRFGVFEDEDGGTTIIVLDCFLQIQSVYHMLRITLSVALACIAIVFVLLVFFSRQAIRPFVENMEKQRQFVTDASHELKTPLTILSADLALLQDSYGEDHWLTSAKAQIARLDKLIQNLVELARTEETTKESQMFPFSVSEVAQATADAFQPLAEAAGKNLMAEIVPDLFLKGIQDNFFRLFSILLDNAVKYCDNGGTICFSLSQRGRNLSLSVSNPCTGVDTSQTSRWFDRFYRADSSRARTTGGYGIGLSTAKAIVTRHKGKITARCTGNTVTFTAVFPAVGI